MLFRYQYYNYMLPCSILISICLSKYVHSILFTVGTAILNAKMLKYTKPYLHWNCTILTPPPPLPSEFTVVAKYKEMQLMLHCNKFCPMIWRLFHAVVRPNVLYGSEVQKAVLGLEEHCGSTVFLSSAGFQARADDFAPAIFAELAKDPLPRFLWFQILGRKVGISTHARNHQG